ncbi:hypothetical protein UFOVP1623_22 [uncultured Caudovirales phage]|uniref:Uncharacterized protein n=1 Tax=uncultured Caudovirales phage TaxID=2100421 RepID=A0A6J5S2H9_9CAUD|nr:hypothetical protein UFOVP1376_41 [uncultured Caudovirales phage]CAB4220710.1 hypothetical protein UFOVP1623_22 [uncultured Caudovirales phage]
MALADLLLDLEDGRLTRSKAQAVYKWPRQQNVLGLALALGLWCGADSLTAQDVGFHAVVDF